MINCIQRMTSGLLWIIMPRRCSTVDTLDELCRQYWTKNGTHRWPLYFTLLGICIHNTSVVLFDIDTCAGIRMASANELTVDDSWMQGKQRAEHRTQQLGYSHL